MAPTTLLSIAASVLGLAGLVGGGLLYLRRSFVRERDEVRQDAVESWREVADAREALREAQLAHADEHIARLERHHQTTHPRCLSAPTRDA